MFANAGFVIQAAAVAIEAQQGSTPVSEGPAGGNGSVDQLLELLGRWAGQMQQAAAPPASGRDVPDRGVDLGDEGELFDAWAFGHDAGSET